MKLGFIENRRKTKVKVISDVPKTTIKVEDEILK